MTEIQPLVIFGAGGFGREALQIVHDQNRMTPTWDFRGFLVDTEYASPEQVHGFPVLGGAEWLRSHPDVRAVIAIGSPAARRRVARTITAYGTTRFATLVHPTVWRGEHVQCGDGVIICAGSLLTTDIVVRDHVIINIDCTLGHDDIIEEFVTLSPGVHVSGKVRVGAGVEVGTGAVLLPDLSVGDGAVIGAASCVTKSLPGDCVAVGVPTKIIKTRQLGWHAE